MSAAGATLTITLEGVDKVSQTLATVGSNVAGLNGKIQDVSKTSDAADASLKDLAFGFTGVSSSVMSLFMMYERVQDAAVAVDRSNLTLKRSTETLDQAQKNYTETLAKYGVGSAEAKDAADKLAIAQDAVNVATERADMAQRHQNDVVLQSAVQVLPTMMTMIASIALVTANWTSMVGGLGSAMTFLGANPIVLVIAGIAALVVGIIYAYNNFAPFRDLLNTIGAVLSGAFLSAWNAVSGAVSWFSTNVVQPLGQALMWLWKNVLLPLANFLVGTLLAAWKDVCAGFSWAYNNILKPIFDGVQWFLDNVVKPIQDFFAGGGTGQGTGPEGSGGQSGEGPPTRGGGLQHGGIVTKPMFSLIGEAGPEAVIPLDRLAVNGGGSHVVNNYWAGPLLTMTIEGSADEATVKRASEKVLQQLKSVVVEATSSGAPATQKRIRRGAVFT